MRFSDFKPNPDDPVVFYIPEDGKTGSRRVAFFPELKPYYDAVRSAALPDQEFVCAIPLFVRNFVYFSFIAKEVICEQ